MFTPYTRDTGALQPWEYYPAAVGTYQVGQMLDVSDGKLTAITSAKNTTPAYLCMHCGEAAEGQIIPVIRVTERVVYKTMLTAAATDAQIGSKLQVSADGLGVDAGAAGTFELTYIDETAEGSMVCGRFR